LQIHSANKDEVKAAAGSLDLIINTISATFDPEVYLSTLLKINGVMCLVGLPSTTLAVEPGNVVFGRRSFAGSLIGG
jgi:uncharacterized zinc-type alcohol dehydrogenase-like protein